jgi:TM2 domain-containing membrane protein YozV
MPQTENASDKKILPAFLLAFFIGVLGIHRFYVGKIGTGIVMIVLTVTIIGMIASGIWALIDWIMIVTGNFTDKNGKKLVDWT